MSNCEEMFLYNLLYLNFHEKSLKCSWIVLEFLLATLELFMSKLTEILVSIKNVIKNMRKKYDKGIETAVSPFS